MQHNEGSCFCYVSYCTRDTTIVSAAELEGKSPTALEEQVCQGNCFCLACRLIGETSMVLFFERGVGASNK